MQKFQVKQRRIGSGVQGKSSINHVLKSIRCFNYIPHNKTLFSNTITSHIVIIY